MEDAVQFQVELLPFSDGPQKVSFSPEMTFAMVRDSLVHARGIPDRDDLSACFVFRSEILRPETKLSELNVDKDDVIYVMLSLNENDLHGVEGPEFLRALREGKRHLLNPDEAAMTLFQMRPSQAPSFKNIMRPESDPLEVSTDFMLRLARRVGLTEDETDEFMSVVDPVFKNLGVGFLNFQQNAMQDPNFLKRLESTLEKLNDPDAMNKQAEEEIEREINGGKGVKDWLADPRFSVLGEAIIADVVAEGHNDEERERYLLQLVGA